MDAGLSLIMANMGGVDKNHIVFDPFVGTGSLLVACAHHGAYVMGTDIDYMLIHAKGVCVCVCVVLNGVCVCMCTCMCCALNECVCGERERENVYVCVCVCVESMCV